MNVIQTSLPDVLLIEPSVYGDARGFFKETYQLERYSQYGIPNFVQDNYSRSRKGVLRGLHYQLENPQGKLISVTHGEAFDVAVDIRIGSPTFATWFGTILSESNHKQLYIPPGFAHGFLALSDSVDFSYKCTNYYCPQDEYTIIWNDPTIGINWSAHQISLSDKDKAGKALQSISPNMLPKYHK